MKNTKKNSKKSRTNLKINKQTMLIIIAAVCAVLLITGTIIGIRAYKKNKADRTVRIAFYGLSENMVDLFKEKIPQEENIILNFDVISDGDFDAGVVKNKYDMLFTWKGEITDTLSASAEDIPQRIFESIPSSLRDKKKKCIPIVLDHCELSFYSKVLTDTNTTIPYSFSSYKEYLKVAKGKVFSPFFCNGAEDRILIDLMGAIVLAEGGLKAYNKLIDELRKVESLEALLDVKLDQKDLTIRSILDMLKEWPKEGYTHPSWYNGRGNDLVYFAESNQLGSFFTLLSEHRKIPYNIIKNFESSLFPTEVNANNYGLIAPAVSVMLLSDNSNCKRYIGAFFTEEAQTEFSDKTNLAPVHYRAQAYDRQADDVRFWAASCAGGALPDLYLAVYQRRPDDLAKMCAEIRGYLR